MIVKQNIFILLGLTLALVACQKLGSAPSLADETALSDLDILRDYDRDIWTGPDGWTDEQWYWKKKLKWDRECDYIGLVETYDIDANYQLITVQCFSGAYQSSYYLYLFDKNSESNKQLQLGLPSQTDDLREVSGTIEFTSTNKTLSILSLSRGLGDCGTYRVFQFYPGPTLDTSEFKNSETRSKSCQSYDIEINALDGKIFDYKNWPLIQDEFR